MRSSPPLNRRGSGKGHQGKGGQRPDGDAPPTPAGSGGVHAALAALANPRPDRRAPCRNPATPADRLPHGTKVEVLEPDAIDRLLPMGAVHQGLAVRCAPLEPEDLLDACAPPRTGARCWCSTASPIPQNVGRDLPVGRSIWRARHRDAGPEIAPPLTGALAKAAAGAIEIVPHARVVNIARAIEELAEAGYVTVGLEGEADMSLAQALDDLRPPVIVLGAEGAGLARPGGEKRATCARAFPIAPHMESLNVSVAAAVALYEAGAAQGLMRLRLRAAAADEEDLLHGEETWR